MLISCSAVNSATIRTRIGKRGDIYIWVSKGRREINGIGARAVSSLVAESDPICQSLRIPFPESSKFLYIESKMRIPKRPLSASLCLSLFSSPPPEILLYSSPGYRILHFHSGVFTPKFSDYSSYRRSFLRPKGLCLFFLPFCSFFFLFFFWLLFNCSV